MYTISLDFTLEELKSIVPSRRTHTTSIETRRSIGKSNSKSWESLSNEEKESKSKIARACGIKGSKDYWEGLDEETKFNIVSRRMKGTWSNYSSKEKADRIKSTIGSSSAQLKVAYAVRERLGKLSKEDKLRYAKDRILSSSSRAKAIRTLRETLDSMSDEEKSLKYGNYFRSLPSSTRSLIMERVWSSYTPEQRESRVLILAESNRSSEKRGLQSRIGRYNLSKLSSEDMAIRMERSCCNSESQLKSARSNSRGTSEPELFLGMYLEESFPGTWAYNGNGEQGIVVGNRIPDFIRADGTKEVISEMGIYWHEESDEIEEIEYYKSYGYKCTIVWDWDCYLLGELDKIFNPDLEELSRPKGLRRI